MVLKAVDGKGGQDEEKKKKEVEDMEVDGLSEERKVRSQRRAIR